MPLFLLYCGELIMDMGFYNHEEWDGYPNTCLKRKNRWRFIITDVSASGVGSLPPSRMSRPSLSFKEMQAEHLNETITFPSKPEWKPITLTLYDIVKGTENPVFTWLKRQYNPTPTECSYWKPCLESPSLKVAECFLEEYDGCGNIVEKWVFEHVWPQSIEFFEGDMNTGEIAACDVTLRYDRAYIAIPTTASTQNMNGILPSYTCSVTPAVSIIDISGVEMPMFFGVPQPDFMIIR